MQRNDLFGLIGFSGLIGSLLTAAVICIFAVYTLIRKNKQDQTTIIQLVILQIFLISLPILSILLLLGSNAFEFPIVFDAVEMGMPFLQKISGLWSSQAGSLMFWSFLMTFFILVAVRKAKKMPDWRYLPLVALILEIFLLFFVIPVVFISSPFEKFWILRNGAITTGIFAPVNSNLLTPVDGQGMNPMLRHPAMLSHPPFLYLGLIGFFVPFAFTLASLITGDTSNLWTKLNYKVILFSWTCLTVGMVLGSWWAYTILGWGGYWGWDAVEISGLLPWLLSFGLVHSIFSYQKDLSMRRWVVTFSLLTVVFILLGILITRSGIIDSVHAYAAGGMGPVLTILIVIVLAISGYFLIRGRDTFTKNPIKNSFYRKLTIVFNWLLIILVAFYLFGQTLPISSRMFGVEDASFLPSQYETYSAPLLLAVILVTAFHAIPFDKGKKKLDIWRVIYLFAFSCILSVVLLAMFGGFSFSAFLGFTSISFLLLSWIIDFAGLIGKQFRRKSPRNNPMLFFGKLSSFMIHFGLGLMALGIMGTESLSNEHELIIGANEATAIESFDITIGNREIEQTDIGKSIYQVPISFESDSLLQAGRLTLEMHLYPKLKLINSIPKFTNNIFGDVQVILKDWETENGKLAIQINQFPLINWIWIGCGMMSFGGLLALFKKTKP